VTAVLRLVASVEPDAALRPTSFDDFVGQREVVGNLRISVNAAKRNRRACDHFLFTGPAGVGKTSLANVIAAELGVRLHVTSAPAIEHKGELASLLTSLGERDVLFIDEIHRLAPPLQEMLYTAMEDFQLDLVANKKLIRVPLPRFTLLGATTHAGMLAQPLLDRFGFVWQLKHYDLADITAIVARSAAQLRFNIDELGAAEIARRSRGTPRIANRLLRRVRDYVEDAVPSSFGNGLLVDASIVILALDQLGIDRGGLGDLDRAYLKLVCDRPVGIEALCASLGESRGTLEENVEPFLLAAGLISRAARGRVATEAGRAHLESA
jgi:holliday junction DNA helicase RuvB